MLAGTLPVLSPELKGPDPTTSRSSFDIPAPRNEIAPSALPGVQTPLNSNNTTLAARFTFLPEWPRGNTAITFDASTSTTPSGSLQYHWDWTNDGTWDTNFSTSATAPHTFGAAGTYTVRLEVMNSTGVRASVTRTVIADDASPTTTAALSGQQGLDGWYLGDVSVALTATDDRSGTERTIYRLDGNWQLYQGPFVVRSDGPHTVDYQSMDRAENWEPLKSIGFRKDASLPVTVPRFGGIVNGTSFLTSIVVFLNATDVGSGVRRTHLSEDEAPWSDYGGPFSVSRSGRHAFRFFSEDVAGNSEAEHAYTFDNGVLSPFAGLRSRARIDGIAGTDGWYRSPVNVTLEAEPGSLNPDAIWYRRETGSWTRFAQAFPLRGDGLHIVDFNATAGDLLELTHRRSIGIDTAPPVTAARFAGEFGEGGWYVTEVTATLDPTDAMSGVGTIRYRMANGAWQTYSAPFVLRDGRHVVEYRTTDRAGNEEAVRSATVSVDLTPPLTTATLSGTLGNGSWHVSDVSVTLYASDSSSGPRSTTYRLDLGEWRPYSGPILVASGGRHGLEFASVDAAGNREDVQAVPVNIEKATPYFLSVSSPTNGTPSPVRISWVAADNDSGILGYAISVDGGPFASIGTATEITLELAEGIHTVQVKAIDVAGRATVRTFTVHIVSQAPP